MAALIAYAQLVICRRHRDRALATAYATSSLVLFGGDRRGDEPGTTLFATDVPDVLAAVERALAVRGDVLAS